ncbi:MAG: hypothetical protein D6803_06265 [Anaerolineae bacterium]|nr:MAG: hypothetical protein D6803_06265 [Anaerolineae bacterium]
MATYKISFVVINGEHPGGLINTEKEPHIGDILTMGGESFEILELVELIPPRGEMYYLHATCKPAENASAGGEQKRPVE